MVGVFKRGKILYIQYKVNGKQVQKSTRLSDTKQNRKLIEDEVIPVLKVKLFNSDFDNKKPKLFNEYSKFYLEDKKYHKTIKSITSKVKSINEYFGNKRIDTIRKHDVKLWVQEQDKKGNTPKTIRNYLSVLRGVIDVAIDEEIITHNVATNIKLSTHEVEEIEPFTELEVRLLLSKSNGFLKLFLAISFYTGARTGEVLALMHSDINLKTKIIEIKRALSEGELSTPKTLKSIREVPIFDNLIPYLKDINYKSLFLFPKNDGSLYKSLAGHHKREWIKLLKDCNINYRKIYTTRHTFIVHMLKHSDLSIMQIAQIVGHTSTKMIIQNYAKFIKGEHLKVNRDLNLFTDKITVSTSLNT
ncbi:MAG: tyrosine-type recombinase/integrase [Epsilonproteobacteria bacterium]|nr:tyrosine-type recombinase/integrase [Campylobacterota bacterium]